MIQGEICIRALDHDKIKLKCARDHEHGTGTCIVLSGRSDRSFVTDRAAVGEMSLHWFGDYIHSFEGISHVHAAGFFNCTKLMKELPEYFRKVGRCFPELYFSLFPASNVSPHALYVILCCMKAFDNGVTTSLNPQYDATESWDGGIRDMAPFLTLFICNEVTIVSTELI